MGVTSRRKYRVPVKVGAVLLVAAMIVFSVWLGTRGTLANASILQTVTAMHIARVLGVLLIWFVFWQPIATWIAEKLAIEPESLIKRRYRFMLWYLCFELVFLMGVSL